jgi:hypothetical protein
VDESFLSDDDDDQMSRPPTGGCRPRRRRRSDLTRRKASRNSFGLLVELFPGETAAHERNRRRGRRSPLATVSTCSPPTSCEKRLGARRCEYEDSDPSLRLVARARVACVCRRPVHTRCRAEQYTAWTALLRSSDKSQPTASVVAIRSIVVNGHDSGTSRPLNHSLPGTWCALQKHML